MGLNLKMKPSNKISVPDILEKFKDFYSRHKSWQTMSLVLLKANYDNHSAQFCLSESIKENNQECVELSRILVDLSATQRMKLAKLTNTV